MQNQQLLVTALAILAFGAVAALVSLTNGSQSARAGVSTPTATPCPIHTVPDPNGDGCIKVTQTMTPTPCPPDYEPGPTPGQCVLGTPPGFPTRTPTPCPTHQFPVGGQCATITPTFTSTPCPTQKVPDTFGGSGCGTPTPSPTSHRPYGAQVTLVDHYPSPAVSGHKKTWVFEIENIGSQYGCEPHEVSLGGSLVGQSEARFNETRLLACHETAQIVVSSIVTVPVGATVGIVAMVEAGAQTGNAIEVTDDVISPPPPTPPRALGDFNCDGFVNAVDATLVLQISAGIYLPLPCTGDGDVNHDGELNPLDAFLMLQYHAHLITGFP